MYTISTNETIAIVDVMIIILVGRVHLIITCSVVVNGYCLEVNGKMLKVLLIKMWLPVE
jgi:hypothetical protein